MARTRPLKPRATSALAIVPVTVTDRTAPAVLGLEPRVFRELVARERIPHAVIGRRIVVAAQDVLDALGRIAARPVEAEVDEETEPVPTASDMLRKLGRSAA
jgi:hypothetical protein